MNSPRTIDAAEGTARPSLLSSLPHCRIALVLVGVMFLLVQLAVVPRPLGLSSDEANYLAKVDPRVPELYWSQSRAWGIPVLAFPVAVFSPGLLAIRMYFGSLASLGVVAAFWPWLRLFRPSVAPAAALFFSTTWFTVAFGSQAMPNLYVALGAVALVGLFLRSLQEPAWWRLALTGAAAVLVALVRPTDSVLVAAPLFALALVVERLRRLQVMAAVAVGGVVGWVPWIIEAYLRFGGPLARLQGAETVGPGGLDFKISNLVIYLRIIDGLPLYCCLDKFNSVPGAEEFVAQDPGPISLPLTIWLAGVTIAAGVGVAVATLSGRLPEMLLLLLPAALIAGFYLVLPSFITARFVMPAFALVSLPIGLAITSVLSKPPRLAGALTAAALISHIALMLPLAEKRLDDAAKPRISYLRAAAAVQPLVAGRPCLVIGGPQQALGYYLGCDAHAQERRQLTPPEVSAARAEGMFVLALLTSSPPPGSYLASWQPVPVPGLAPRFQVYVPRE